MCPFREADVPVFTPEMSAFNTAMSEVRVSVEWLFGDIVEYFKFVDYKKKPYALYECGSKTIHRVCTF